MSLRAASMVERLTRIGPHEHACLIYASEDEKSDVVAEFLRGALAANERYMHILHGTAPDAFRAAMAARGVDLRDALASGQVALAHASDTYLAGGAFEGDVMLQFLVASDSVSRADGYCGSRATGEMEWWPSDSARIDSVERYESALNELLPRLSTHGICLYDERALTSERLAVVLRTHPKVVYRGRVCENPFYGANVQVEAGSPERELAILLHAQQAKDAMEANVAALIEVARRLDRIRLDVPAGRSRAELDALARDLQHIADVHAPPGTHPATTAGHRHEAARRTRTGEVYCRCGAGPLTPVAFERHVENATGSRG